MSFPTGGGGLSEFLGGWVSNRPTLPRRGAHCVGLWVGAEGAGQGMLPVVRHFACGSWVDGWMGGCPIASPPPLWGGTFVGLWVCQKSGGGAEGLYRTLRRPPPPQRRRPAHPIPQPRTWPVSWRRMFGIRPPLWVVSWLSVMQGFGNVTPGVLHGTPTVVMETFSPLSHS